MHQFHVMGIAPDSLSAVVGAIKNIPGMCNLVWEQDTMGLLEPEDEKVHHTGPLLEAPIGVYHLWVTSYSEPLLITSDKILLGRSLLLKKDLVNERRILVDATALIQFRKLLTRSEKQLHVWQAEKTGDQRYKLLWPGEEPDPFYDDTEFYPYIGVANLKNGRIDIRPMRGE